MVQNTKVHYYSGKKMEANYKPLSKVGKKFLGVPATSSPVERVLSQAGESLRAD